jgi:hypothetical protein
MLRDLEGSSLEALKTEWSRCGGHAYNPNYLGGRDRRIAVQGQPGEKVSKSLWQKHKPGVVVYTCNPSFSGGKGRKIVEQGCSRQEHETLSGKKQNKIKMP